MKAKIEAITNARGKSGLHAVDWNNEPRVGAPEIDDDCEDESVSAAPPPRSSSSPSVKSPSRATSAYMNSNVPSDSVNSNSHSSVRPPKYEGPGALSPSLSDVYRSLPPPLRRQGSSTEQDRDRDRDRDKERDRRNNREFDGGVFDNEGREKERAARHFNNIHPDRRHHHMGDGGGGSCNDRRHDRRSFSPDDRRGGRGRSDSGGDHDRSMSPYSKRGTAAFVFCLNDKVVVFHSSK